MVNMFTARKRTLTTKDLQLSYQFGKAFFRASWGRTLFLTKNGSLGLGLYTIRPGDKVVLSRGGKTPYVLRKLKDSSYTLVGECFVHGVMQGENFQSQENLSSFQYCIDTSRWTLRNFPASRESLQCTSIA